MAGKDKDWIEKTHMKRGGLRARLGLKPGQKLTPAMIREAERSKNRTEEREGHLAATLEQLNPNG